MYSAGLTFVRASGTDLDDQPEEKSASSDRNITNRLNPRRINE
jgi:hypothetical protein